MKMKRFQECNKLEKAWRYRHYLLLPFKWLWYQYFSSFYITNDETFLDERLRGISSKNIIKNLILLLTPKSKRKYSIIRCQLWGILVGIAQQEMGWYYTLEEIKAQFGLLDDDVIDDIDDSEYWKTVD